MSVLLSTSAMAQPITYSGVDNSTIKPADIITTGPWLDSRTKDTIELANTAAFNAGKLLVVTQNYVLTDNTVLTAATKIIKGGSFSSNELLTLDVAPTPADFAAGATITGATSTQTCVVISKLTSTTYRVKNRTGAFTLGEVLSDGTNSANQGAANPTFTDAYTLTINGPFEAGLYQVFSGFAAGNVTLGVGAAKEVYSEWWGAAGDLATDDATAIQSAITASSNVTPAVLLNRGYKANTQLTMTTNFQKLKGQGVASVIWGNHAGYVLQVGNGITERVGIAVEDLYLWSPTGKGLLVTQANKSNFKNLWSWSAGNCFTVDELSIINTFDHITASSNLYGSMRTMYPLLPTLVSTGIGILVQRTTAESNALTFISPLVEGVGSHGIMVQGTHVTITFINPLSEGNAGWGFYFDGNTGYNGNLTLINPYTEANTLGALYAKKQIRMQILGGQLGSTVNATGKIEFVDVLSSLITSYTSNSFTEDSDCSGNIIISSSTFADNTSTNHISTTAYAKSQDAVLAREPDQGVALTAAASGSSGITVADNDNIDFGTGNFTLVWKGNVPDWTADSRFLTKRLFSGGACLDFANLSTRKFDFFNGTTSYTSTLTHSFVAGTSHEIVCVVTRETASTAGSVRFYTDGILFETLTITAGSPGSYSNNEGLYILGTNATTGQRVAGTVHHAITFNRALTAAEVLDLYRNGPNFADKWGSQTELMPNQVDRDFSGASAWADVDLVAGSGAYDETTDLTITAGAAGAGDYCTLTVASAPTTIGKRYRMTYDLANIVGSWILKDFTGVQTIGTISANATQGYLEWTATTTGGFRLIAVSNLASGDFDNFTLKEIGATLALEPEGIQVDGWKDSSTNGLNATYPAAGSSLTRPVPTSNGAILLSTTTVALNANADTTIYTVPTGKRCVLTHAILVAGADAGATSAISIGADGSETDFIPAAVLSNLDAANDAVILQPVPVAALPVKNKSYAADTVIQAQVATQSGGATNTLYLFGFLY